MMAEMIGFKTSPSATNATQPVYTDFPEYQTSVVIWKWVSPLLICIGTVGSILSLAVLCRRRLRNTTAMFYLAVLAVADICVLYTGLLRYWIYSMYGTDVRLMSNFSCKIHVFLVYTSLDYAAWILVALTVDRCLFVCAPFRARGCCTVKNARIIAVSILVALLVLNCHMFWTYGLSSRTIFGDGEDCDAAKGNMTKFVTVTWAWIDFGVVCFVPFSVMIVSNGVIIRQLAISAKKIRGHHMNEKRSEQIDSKTVGQNSNVKTSASDQHKIQKISTVSTSTVGNRPRTQNTRMSSLNVMLLSVNCLFLLLTSPIVVYLIGFATWRENPDPQSEARLMLGWCLVNMFQYANNAGHFFLYCMSGPRFRKEMLSMVAVKNKVHVNTSQTRDG